MGDLLWLAAAIALALLTMPVYRFGPARGRPDPDGMRRGGSFAMGRWVRDWFLWFIGPAERAALALNVPPVAFNLLGVVVGITSAILIQDNHMVSAGWVMLLGSIADIFDGRIARARGLASPRGAFLDSTLDRFAETAIFVGLAIFYHDVVGRAVVTTALGGSLLVSYTRARGESLHVLCRLGLMQRAERVIAVGVGAVVDPSLSHLWGRPQGSVLVIILGLVAAGTVATAVYRTVWISRRLAG